MSIRRNIYNGAQSVLHECELTAAEFDEMINRSALHHEKLKSEVKEEPEIEPDASRATTIVVTKYEDPSHDMLDVEPSVELDNKGKLIQVDLLPSSQLRNLLAKRHVAPILRKGSNKKLIKRKMENSENKKQDGVVKVKRLKSNYSIGTEQLKLPDDVLTNEGNEDIKQLGSALCSKCGKNFSSNYNLKRHMTSCKLCPDEEKGPRFVCQCGRTYSQEWDMKKHRVKCKDCKKKCKRCLVSNCNLLFYHKAQLITHMKRDHNVNIQDPEILNFNSFDEFISWKEREEEETYTYYSKQTGSNVTGVSVNTYYVCQHDGSDRAHSSRPRKTERRNKKGRIKTGRLCWSQMNVKQFKDGTVRVTYFPSHTHPVTVADTEHHPLPSSISLEIKRRLSEIKPDVVEEVPPEENIELKKVSGVKKKRIGVTLRALRSLARKNRNLFRITADALQETEEPQTFSKPKVVLTANSLNSDGNFLQVLVTEQEENIDDPDEMMIPPDNIDPTNKTREENSSLYLSALKNILESGKLDPMQVTELNGALKDLVGKYGALVREVDQLPAPATVAHSQPINQVYQETSPLTSVEGFPLQDAVATIDMNDTLKQVQTATQEKTIYQLVTLDKDKTTADNPEYLYQNAVEVVGAREFIIIAGDHTQFFQSVNGTTQFDLTS